MKDLTPRQQQILQLIEQHINDTGFPPTRMDICQALGFRSPNAAEEHLRALARKGAITLTSGASRGIRLNSPTASASSAAPKNKKGLFQAGAEEAMELLAGSLTAALSIPLLGRVAAGQPMLAQEHVEAQYAIDPALFAQAPDYLLKVRGMSMRDAGILEGDLLAVRKLPGGATEARNGQIVVARLHDEVTVKRFKREGRQVQLLPENPDFKPILVSPEDESFAIEGLGIGVIRNPKAL
jgi:repressor LexA